MTTSAFAQAAQAAAPEKQAPFFHCSFRCWLPEKGSKLHAQMKVDQTQSGNGRVRFAAAPTGYDEQANDGQGGYLSGRLFTFEATDNGYGPLATAVLNGINDNERLVEIKAQFQPLPVPHARGRKAYCRQVVRRRDDPCQPQARHRLQRSSCS